MRRLPWARSRDESTVDPKPGAPTMRATGIRVRRGHRDVLHGVDFAVHTGEVVALVGPNGAGKSTVLAALAGDQPLTAGTVEVDGVPLDRWPAAELARRRAVLPQQHTIGFPFTARQVVRMGRAAWAGTSRRHDDERIVAAAFETCDVTHLADRPFPALSGGERARVALARVLAQDTETLLLDEPTAALDIGHQEAVMQVVRQRADAGHAVVVVLHDLGLAAAYADRICVLEHGRIVADAPPPDVLTEDLIGRVYQYPVAVTRHPETGTPLVLPRRGSTGQQAAAG